MSLITPHGLDDLLRSAAPPVVLDVRWRLDAPDGRAAFRDGHVPTAQYVSLDDELAAHGAPTDGRHPLPAPEALQASAQGWGIGEGDTVVVYDDWMSFGASRAWWSLTDAGVDVRVLDGGLSAWRDAGLLLETGEAVTPPPGDVTLRPGRLARLSMDEAGELAREGLLLDVRAAERYRGEVEPLDPRAGHIPGALSASTADNNDDAGRLLPVDILRERFAALGVQPGEPVGVYCGSGVSASHAALALTIAGFRPALYPGSWSQWSNHPDRPVATGAHA
jgi:thiosulfate/3-mercaptopyruvate sulfurtransferase